MSADPAVERFDVVVVGSGAAGLSAALSAARRSLRVAVLESTSLLGGTSALSGGWLWVPGASRAESAVGDSADDARRYICSLAGEHFRADLVDAFLDAAPSVVAELEAAGVRLSHAEAAPDYQMDAPGARFGGRAISAESFDARRLAGLRLALRPPLTSMTVFGVVPQIGPELSAFVRANRSPRAFAFVLRTITRATWQRLRYRRPTRLTNGNSLTAQLLLACQRAGVTIRTESAVETLVTAGGRVSGVEVTGRGRSYRITADRGVVLACGGISQSREHTSSLFAHVGRGQAHHSMVTAEHDGAAARLAAPVGGHVSAAVGQAAAWAPVTTFGTGPTARAFPHLRAIGLPGLVAVNVDGLRFANEADSYHAFGQAMSADAAHRPDTHVFLVADARTMRRYGIGYAKPWPVPRLRYLRSGYLTKAGTVRELAARCGIDADALERTVATYNASAVDGNDPAFHRGESVYNTFRGDSEHRPNPSVGPVGDGPYYAVRVVLGDLGAFAGLDIDGDGRVLRADGAPVAGLFAAGAAALSVFGGAYPGYGAMLGPGIVIGARAGRALASDDQR